MSVSSWIFQTSSTCKHLPKWAVERPHEVHCTRVGDGTSAPHELVPAHVTFEEFLDESKLGLHNPVWPSDWNLSGGETIMFTFFDPLGTAAVIYGDLVDSVSELVWFKVRKSEN